MNERLILLNFASLEIYLLMNHLGSEQGSYIRKLTGPSPAEGIPREECQSGLGHDGEVSRVHSLNEKDRHQCNLRRRRFSLLISNKRSDNFSNPVFLFHSQQLAEAIQQLAEAILIHHRSRPLPFIRCHIVHIIDLFRFCRGVLLRGWVLQIITISLNASIKRNVSGWARSSLFRLPAIIVQISSWLWQQCASVKRSHQFINSA